MESCGVLAESMGKSDGSNPWTSDTTRGRGLVTIVISLITTHLPTKYTPDDSIIDHTHYLHVDPNGVMWFILAPPPPAPPNPP